MPILKISKTLKVMRRIALIVLADHHTLPSAAQMLNCAENKIIAG
jgi:hypothetical protein